MQESGRKPSPSQAYEEGGEHYNQLDHGKGDRSGHKDNPSSTQKRSGGEHSDNEVRIAAMSQY